jgi:hypothetical protein
MGDAPAVTAASLSPEQELGNQEAVSTFRIAPPTLAPSYPPLVPPRIVSAPPFPIASSVARQGAGKAEAAQATGDLNELATKIKRILDEEARRHGIDV